MKTSKTASKELLKTDSNPEISSATAEKLRKASHIDSNEVCAMLDRWEH